ncbi:MAG: hypothetical protein JXR05_05655 [Flavobacteriaceae bacterium]
MLTKRIKIAGMFLLSTLVFTGCKEESSFKKIDFTPTYKFSSEIEDKVAKDTVPWKYQISASDYAAKGDYKNALKHWDLAMGARERTYSESEVDSIRKKYKVVDARQYIVEQAKKTNVVIINEAHHNSSHRYFTKTLLQDLYDQGYRNLGLEAMDNEKIDSLLSKRKYPIKETGYYIKDPQFGDMIRTALEIGYKVFPYEQTTGVNGKLREIEQAKNIQKVIEQRPNEKFLIHCGFAHVLKGEYRGWEKTMTGRLIEYLDINPLTIHQTMYSEKSDAKNNHPLMKAMDVKSPSVLLDEENHPLQYKRGKTWADIAVLHPKTDYLNGRPSWLFSDKNSLLHSNFKKLKMSFPIMVLAYKKGEDIHTSVPVDIMEVETKEEIKNLILSEGAYTIVYTNKEGDSWKQDIKI